MKTVDLHVHSTYSDGTLTPSELVALAKNRNLSAMALTDHDTIAGIAEAIDSGLENDIEIIPGIELSACYGTKEIHILGLFIDYEDKGLQNQLNKLIEVRNVRNLIMAEKFKEFGIDISMEEMVQRYGNAVLTRAHFADYLMKKGYVSSRNQAFERYIGDRSPCYIPREKLQPKDALELIKSAKGLPILAHPVLYHMSDSELEKLVSNLSKEGLMGIEAIYSTYTKSEERFITALANKYHLFISGGSDFHGANKPYLNLGTGKGNLKVPYDILEKIKSSRSLILE